MNCISVLTLLKETYLTHLLKFGVKVYSINCLLGIVVDGNSFNLLSHSYIAKNINLSISSSKFSTHRVSKKCTLGNFQKLFLVPKMAAILYFRIFAKNGKIQFYSEIPLPFPNSSYLLEPSTPMANAEMQI